MEETEPEYYEVFEKTTENPQYVYQSVLELYTRDKGWVVGEPNIVKVDERNYKISIPLSKYRVERNSRNF